MGLMDDLTGALEKISTEAEKALNQGKAKVGQLQLERQMDAAARKVGYMELDRYRGRPVDDSARAELIYQMAGLEDQIAASQAAPAEETKTAEQTATPAEPAEPTQAPPAPGGPEGVA